MDFWLRFGGMMLGYIVIGVITFVIHENLWTKNRSVKELSYTEYDNAMMLSCAWPFTLLFWVAVCICLAVYLPIALLVGFIYSSIGKLRDALHNRKQHKLRAKELIAKHGYVPVELPKDIEEILYKDLK